MKLSIPFLFAFALSAGCTQPKVSEQPVAQPGDSTAQREKSLLPAQQAYAEVNGIKMYYEIHGSGQPLVLIHGGGSTIYTSFGSVLPFLAKTHKVIAVELQAHGHTSDRNTPESFVQDANDVTELLHQLNIPKADFFGFSNGAQTAMQLALLHPEKVNKLVLASMFYKREGTPAAFWEGMVLAKLTDMPQVYKDEFLKINKDSAALLNMFTKDANRMRTFKGWTDEDIRSIQAPTFIVIGDQDLTRPEHAVEMHLLMQNSRLAILPGNHGSYMGEIMSADPASKEPEYFVELVNTFLSQENTGKAN
ncbi:MAG TPA: alpha/beta hydrolase [Bacteroidia bacterium]|jgi:pimeloyl-ACP methyl ester carboxylesterase|nr:alpha/beta hydrolase [Bacteroidia bacterium]